MTIRRISQTGQAKGKIPTKGNHDSTANKQVSNESIPNVSISLNNQIPDKRQAEVGPSEHNKEVQEPYLEHIYTTGNMGNTLTWGDQ
jgi:hypothetical protein